jgi:hypothetical protein
VALLRLAGDARDVKIPDTRLQQDLNSSASTPISGQ